MKSDPFSVNFEIMVAEWDMNLGLLRDNRKIQSPLIERGAIITLDNVDIRYANSQFSKDHYQGTWKVEQISDDGRTFLARKTRKAAP